MRVSRDIVCLPSALAIATLTAAPAMAQSETDEAAGDDNVIVVVGTPGGRGVNQLDANFAVTTFDEGDLRRLQPVSTADLVKAVPGVWSESSGGVAGANIFVRGLPSGGDAPFVSFAVNGSPLFGTNTLSFFETSTLFRPDLTIASVEAIRGGPNAVFAKGEPGATINFALKKGGEATKGTAQFSLTDFGGTRFDGVLSGKLDEGLYYLVGGYVQQSDGVRDAQFTSEEGTQFTAQLTKEFDTGSINIYGRITDDHGQWYLPFSLNNPDIDPGTFSQLGNATRLRNIQVDATGATRTFDFADGRGWDGFVTGANVEFDLGGGFTFRDNVNYVKGDADTFGFVPSGSAVTVADVQAANPAIGPVTTSSGRTLASSDFVQTYGHWVVLKDLESFSNDLSLSKEFGPAGQHSVTVGVYNASFSSEDEWYLGNAIAVQNIANGEPLANVAVDDIAAAGGGGGFHFNLVDAGDARVLAFYVGGTFELTDRLTFDGGIRYEDIDINFVADTAFSDVVDSPLFPDGVLDVNFDGSADEIAWTASLGYDFTDNFSGYVRWSDGFTFPNFDSIREGNTAVQSVEQGEVGLKFNNGIVGVFATGFYTKNDQFQNTVGSVIGASQFTSETFGVEAEANLNLGAFAVDATLTYQDAEIIESTTASDVGNRIQRQPEFQARVSPRYEFDLGSLRSTFYGNLTYAGSRFGDNANTVDLPAYTKIDLGLLVRHDSGVFGQIHADNLNDSAGITEGDPRNPAAPNGRPILGRSVRFTIGYEF